jgi:hypothetical protein
VQLRWNFLCVRIWQRRNLSWRIETRAKNFPLKTTKVFGDQVLSRRRQYLFVVARKSEVDFVSVKVMCACLGGCHEYHTLFPLPSRRSHGKVMMPKKSDVVIIYSWVLEHLKFSSRHRRSEKKLSWRRCQLSHLASNALRKLRNFHPAMNSADVLFMFHHEWFCDAKTMYAATWTNNKNEELSHVSKILSFLWVVANVSC